MSSPPPLPPTPTPTSTKGTSKVTPAGMGGMDTTAASLADGDAGGALLPAEQALGRPPVRLAKLGASLSSLTPTAEGQPAGGEAAAT